MVATLVEPNTNLLFCDGISECEKDQNGTQREFEKQQTKDRKTGREKKKLQVRIMW